MCSKRCDSAARAQETLDSGKAERGCVLRSTAQVMKVNVVMRREMMTRAIWMTSEVWMNVVFRKWKKIMTTSQRKKVLLVPSAKIKMTTLRDNTTMVDQTSIPCGQTLVVAFIKLFMVAV
jgi:hypothetical protein